MQGAFTFFANDVRTIKKKSNKLYSSYNTNPGALIGDKDNKDSCAEPTWQPKVFFPIRAGEPLDCGTICQANTPVKLSKDHREAVKEERSTLNIKTEAEQRFQGGRVYAFKHIPCNYDSTGDINKRRSTLLWRVEGTHAQTQIRPPTNSQLLWNVSLH